MTGAPVVVAGSYAAADERGIRAFGVEPTAGRFVELGGWTGIANPSFLAAAADGRRLYVVSEVGADAGGGSVHAASVSWHGGRPEVVLTSSVPSGGDHPCHLGLDPLGRWVATANYATGDVAIIGLDAHGDVATVGSPVRHRGSGPHPSRQAGPHAHSATPTVDGRHVLVADLGTDRVALYAVAERDGALTLRAEAAVTPGAGPRHTAVHPDGRLVAVANELDSTVTTYLLGPSGDSIVRRDTASTVPDDAPANLVADIHFAPDGRRLYVSNRGHDSIATFDVEPDGTLLRIGVSSCGGSWPRNFAVLADGRHLVAANERSDELVVLTTTAGGVGDVAARVAMPSPTCVVSIGS